MTSEEAMPASDELMSDEEVAAKWAELAPLIDRVTARIADPNDFQVSAGSTLAADDLRSSPFQVTHGARTSIVAAVDHLHAVNCWSRSRLPRAFQGCPSEMEVTRSRGRLLIHANAQVDA
ncbi:hypothetical protein [Nocardia sp. No.11]|uniref:hypothetical protein n=1 Tax=Nocardia sp. No.11 TaxID=3128861 RepID=UPI00319E8BA1